MYITILDFSWVNRGQQACKCVVFSKKLQLGLLDVQSVAAGQEGTTASDHWLFQPRSNLGICLYGMIECAALLGVHAAIFVDV